MVCKELSPHPSSYLNYLRTEAWFGSIPVTDQVETLYLNYVRTEAWFGSIQVAD